MEPSDEATLEAVSSVFARCSRQRLIRDPHHCAECAEAAHYLASLDRSDVTLADIGDRAGFDYFSMLTDEGFRHFIPALCRIALQERPAGLSHLLLRFGRAPAALTEPAQREAIVSFLDYVAAMRYLVADRERRELREIRARLRSGQVGQIPTGASIDRIFNHVKGLPPA